VRIRVQSTIWPAIILATLIAATFPQLGSGLHADNTASGKRVAIDSVEPRFSVEAGTDGEIFPVFANFASLLRSDERRVATVMVSVTNPMKSPLHTRISVEIPGWSETEIQNVTTPPESTQQIPFAPVFRSRLYENREIRPASVVIHVHDSAGRILHSETIPVRLRSAEDMYWGQNFKDASFIASWVTPHDSEIEKVLSRAKEFMPGRRLPGYEDWKSEQQQQASTYAQAKAIYRALQQSGLSYVKSSLTFGRNTDISERVRTPGDTIRHKSANCIDGVVTYASLFENLGMDPEVILVPGHAYVAVRTANGSNDYLYIETALTGRSSFDAAVQAANRGMAKYNPKDVIRIDIAKARQAGIFPMPTPPREFHHGQVESPSLMTSTTVRQHGSQPSR
jgi:hypothetical protein